MNRSKQFGFVVVVFAAAVALSDGFFARTRKWHLSNSREKILGFRSENIQTQRLKIEDILEDDADFLALLRRQMENPLNASPREVTNRIKAFFASTDKFAASDAISSFKLYIEANKDVIDVVNVILILEGSSRYGIPLKDICPWNIILEAMEKPSQNLTSSMVYRGISALSKLRTDDPQVRAYLQALWKATKNADVILNPVDVCSALFNVQALTSSSLPEIRYFLELFRKSLAASTVSLPPKTVCSAIYGNALINCVLH